MREPIDFLISGVLGGITGPMKAAAPASRRPVRFLGLALAALGAALLLGGESRPTTRTPVAPDITRAALPTPAPAITPVALSTSAPAETPSPPAPAPRTRSIEEVRVGDRVQAGNPEAAADEAPVDPASWVKLELTLSNPDDTVGVVLLRPRVWADAIGARVGSTVALDLPELGASGPALVTAVGPCPPLKPGTGRVVTGTFRHRSARVLDLVVEGAIEPIGVTANHPFWSENRHQFVHAGELKPGERLRTLDGQARVASLVPRSGEQAVYNIEVHGDHVYRVSGLGILVHNEYALERYVSAAEADQSLAKGGLHIDPRINGKYKNLADIGTFDPSTLGPKNKINYTYKLIIQVRDGARKWLMANGTRPLGHADTTWQIPANLVDEFNRLFVTGIKAVPR
jgi:hypothetical protein